MNFHDWQDQAEAATRFSGHGSRKKIAKMLGLTSETIKAGETAGKATPKMMKKLTEFVGARKTKKFEEIYGKGGRWNASRCVGGAYVTHVARPLAFTALFQNPDPAVGLTIRDAKVYVTAYDDMSDSQLEDLLDEAREIAGRILGLNDADE